MTTQPTHLELWTRFGRPEDRDAVVEDYRYLCRRAARRFLRAGVDTADLEQVGAIGLIKAVDRYDAGQAAPFEAYAWLLVLGELMHYVRDSERLLRAPRRVRDLEKRWSAAERDLRNLLGREPREDDVAGHLDASPAQRQDLREYRAAARPISFELVPTSEHRDGAARFDAVLDAMAIETFLSILSPLETRIVRGIHLDGIAVVELARQLGYSRRHLTRLHRAAMVRLRTLGTRVAGSHEYGY